MSEKDKKTTEPSVSGTIIGLPGNKVYKTMEDEQQPKRAADQDVDLKSPEHFQVAAIVGRENLCFESSYGRDYNIDPSLKSRNFTSKEISDKLKVQTRKGTTGGLDGYFYEILLLILSRLRGQKYTDKFYLTTSMDGVGAFDDIVLKYWHNKEKTLILLQAKHVEDSGKNKIGFEKFTNPKSDKFYLGKYFRDYLIIREKINEKSEDPILWDNSQVKYIIYTNAILDENFNEKRIIEIKNNDNIDNCIFSTKSKENKNKVFKFRFDDINSDLIATLEKVSRQDKIKSLAKALVKCISNELNYKNMMANELISTYHVFLANTIIDVSGDIKIDKKKIKYREGKLKQDFFNVENKDSLEIEFKEEILFEFVKDVILNKKIELDMGDTDKQNQLLNKIADVCAKKEAKVDEEIINNLGGSIIVLDTKERMLKFANEEKLEDESAKQFIRDLKSKASNLADYTFNIPYECVQKTLEQYLENKPLKLHFRFGNIQPSFEEQKHLIKVFKKLFKNFESEKVIEINDDAVGRGKLLSNVDIKNIGKLVGNLLVFDQEKRMLRLAGEESLDENALKIIEELKTVAQRCDLDVNSLRFDIKVLIFPKYSLDDNGEDRTNVEEFLKVLEVFTGQASDQEIRKNIKDEICNLYRLTKEEVEDNYPKIEAEGVKYWKMDEKYFLEKDDDFFNNLLKCDIVFNVRNPLKSFSGRVEDLQKLHQTLQSKGETAISQEVSVSGLGGIGKTELARKYALDYYREYYDGNVIWINAESYQTLDDSFRRLAQDKLGIILREKENIESIVEKVYDFFSTRKSLFIFDNAEKRRNEVECDEGIDNFLPSFLTLSPNAKKPYILITSRNQNWGNIEVIQLGTFTETEATDFIRKELKINDDLQKCEIQKLSEMLQQFPLALAQAVAYIKQENEQMKNVMLEKGFKIVDYLREYEIKTKELLNFEFPDHSSDKYTRTTFTTFKVSIDKLDKKKKHGKKAMDILEIIAYFEPDHIPTKMFLNSEEDDAIRELGATVQLLKQYSLVNLDDGVLSVHRLVQEVTRINLIDEKRDEEVLRKALKTLKSYDSKINKRWEDNDIIKKVSYIWSYASDYPNLIKDCYTSYVIGKPFESILKTTPLHIFAKNGDTKPFESILKTIKCKSMEKVIEYNGFGYAPIHLAALYGHKKIVECLIEEGGVDVNLFDILERTPLFSATSGGQLHVLQYLLSKGADPNKRSKFGAYPIHIAKRFDLIECLVNNNADINVKDDLDSNVLHSAIYRVDSANLLDTEKLLKFCLNKDPNLLKDINYLGMTPLHLAIKYCHGISKGYTGIVKIFLDYGADVNAEIRKVCIGRAIDVGSGIYKGIDSDIYSRNYTPLHIAVQENSYEIVKILLQKGANYNATNDEGSTPLDFARMDSDEANLLTSIDRSFKAILNDKKEELYYLLTGKDTDTLKSILNASDRNGKTLLQVAVANKQIDIIKLLEDKIYLQQEVKF